MLLIGVTTDVVCCDCNGHLCDYISMMMTTVVTLTTATCR